MHDSFGSLLKQRRRALDLTQKEVAQQVGCSQILLRKLEAAERRPSRQIAELLADVLQIPAYERVAFITAARQLPAKETPRYLPRSTSPFIGRTNELAQLSRYLTDTACRLITLVGPGGIGKTRLALQAANIYGNPYTDGVYFIPLAGLSELGFIAPTIAQHLQHSFVGSESPEKQLMNLLQSKTLLLVLDNFEHLLEGRELLIRMLDSAPHLKLLVTSRERLNLQQEWTLEIQGLDFAEQNDDAVQLFIQRATQVNHPMDPTHIPYVLDICRLLDGMPLGIVLAVSWLYLLTCKEIAEQMRVSLDFLTSEAPDIEVRHRSLRQVFDQSWEMLSPAAQSVLRKISVFRGGFRQEAAEAIAGATLTTLAELRNKSLLRRDESGRFHLHEMLRQYAADHLDARERSETHVAHAHYYAEFTDQKFNPAKTSLEEFSEAARNEIENVRAAWYWSIDNHHLPFLHLMWEGFWFFSQIFESSVAFDYAAAHLHGPNPEIRRMYALMRSLQGWCEFNAGQLELALRHTNEALKCFRTLGINDGRELIHSHLVRTFLLHALGDYEAAQYHARMSINLAQSTESGNFYTVGGYYNLGRIAYSMGDYKACYTAVLQAHQLIQSEWWIAGYAEHGLGRVEVVLGNHENGEMHLQKSLRIFSSLDDQRGVALALIDLGHLAVRRQIYDEAWLYYREAARIAYMMRLTSYLMEVIAEIGYLFTLTERVSQGLEWLTFVLNHPSSWQEARDNAARYLLDIQGELPDLRLSLAQERGTTVTLEEIMSVVTDTD